jgi:hypothetical protein
MSKKFDEDEAIQAYVAKKVDAALKAERKRVALAVKGMPVPSCGSKKEAMAIIKKMAAAVAAPAAQTVQ